MLWNRCGIVVASSVALYNFPYSDFGQEQKKYFLIYSQKHVAEVSQEAPRR
jgi:hypothetical protein